eukprot:Rhum_TRINITY_DN4807_c0_g1::Rhum_TRINITY_DN4807_c0_g1_i1::g.15801::m.15801
MGACCTKVLGVDNNDGLLLAAPDSPGAVTAEWLQRQLAAGGETVDLASVRIEPISCPNLDGNMRVDGGGNSGSRIVRARLTYKPGGNRLPNGADTVVLKWTDFQKVPPLSFNMRVAQVVLFKVNHADLFRTEHYFLTRVKDVHTWGVQLPITYSAAMQDATEPPAFCKLVADSRSKLVTCCVMQDIGAYKIAAQPFANVERKKVVGAFRNIAKLHRATWGQQSKYTGDLAAIYGRNGFCTSHTGLFGLQGSGVYAKKKQFAGSKGPQGLYKIWGVGNTNAGGDIGLSAIQEVASDPTLRKALTDLQQNWSRIFPHLGSIEPQCMVHGDFHHWNNLFGEREDDVMLIDWQYFGAGRPMYELVHFMNSGVDVTTVRDDEEMLQAYYEALVDPASNFPVPQLTYDELMRQYKLAVVDGAVSMCISLGTSTMGVSYTPKDYMSMAKCPKQRDFVVGGMLLSKRLFQRLMALYAHCGSFTHAMGTSSALPAEGAQPSAERTEASYLAHKPDEFSTVAGSSEA